MQEAILTTPWAKSFAMEITSSDSAMTTVKHGDFHGEKYGTHMINNIFFKQMINQEISRCPLSKIHVVVSCCVKMCSDFHEKSCTFQGAGWCLRGLSSRLQLTLLISRSLQCNPALGGNA